MATFAYDILNRYRERAAPQPGQGTYQQPIQAPAAPGAAPPPITPQQPQQPQQPQAGAAPRIQVGAAQPTTAGAQGPISPGYSTGDKAVDDRIEERLNRVNDRRNGQPQQGAIPPNGYPNEAAARAGCGGRGVAQFYAVPQQGGGWVTSATPNGGTPFWVCTGTDPQLLGGGGGGGKGGGGGYGGGGGGGGGSGGQVQQVGLSPADQAFYEFLRNTLEGIISGNDLPFSDEVVAAHTSAALEDREAQRESARRAINSDLTSRGLFRSGIGTDAVAEADANAYQNYSQRRRDSFITQAKENFSARERALENAASLLAQQMQFLLGSESNTYQREIGLAQIQLGYARIQNELKIAQDQLANQIKLAEYGLIGSLLG